MKTLSSKKGNVKANLVCSDLTVKLTPDSITKRNELFSEFYQKQQEEIQKIPKQPIKITLPDGKEVEGVSGETTPLEIAKKISKKLAERVLVAKVKYSSRHSDFFG